MRKKRMLLSFSAIIIWISVIVCAAVVKAADTTITVDTNTVLESNFTGIGVEWDPSDSYDFTAAQWDTIYNRLDFMKLSFVRCMSMYWDYAVGGTPDNPVYDWNTAKMQRQYKILDYCQSRGVTVIIGEWSKPSGAGITSSSDVRWAKMIGDYLNQLVNVKGYTCIKYYNYINEPNGDWSIANESGDKFTIWKTGITNLSNELNSRGLSSIKIIGPDTSGADEWVERTVDNASSYIGMYDIHKYAMNADITGGTLETLLAAKRDYINLHDPNGYSKLWVMGEGGIVEGRNSILDQQPRVKNFEYGVYMADYNAQCIRGKQSGTIMWMLDDAMHNSPGTDPSQYILKTWGFWNTVGNTSDQALRPWYYPMSLMSKYFPAGCTTVAADNSNITGVRVAAAIKANGAKYDVSYVIVNNSDAARTVTVSLPNAQSKAVLKQYNYFDSDRPADSNGFPVAKTTLSNVDLAAGINVSLPSRGCVILTTMDGGTPVTLKTPENLLSNPGFEESGLSGWTKWTNSNDDAVYTEAGGHSGNAKLGYWKNSPYQAYTYQNLTGISNGTYTFRAWVRSSGGQNSCALLVKGYGDADIYGTVNAGSGWNQVNIRNIKVTNGQCTIGLWSDANAGNWCNMDDAEFYMTSSTVAPTILTDTLDNWNNVYAHSTNWAFDTGNAAYFDGDASRLKRTTNTVQTVTYNRDAIKDFTAKVYYKGSITNRIKIYTSPDNNTWTQISIASDTAVSTGGGWYRTYFTPSGSIPAGTNYLKIEFSNDSLIYTPQLSQISIIYN